MYDSHNIFAKIIRKEIPANIILENDYALSFYDINPQAPIHALVIPKGEFISFHDFIAKAGMEDVSEYYKMIHNTVDALSLEPQGYRLICNHGDDANQEILHFHTHILGGANLGSLITNS